MPAPKDPSAKEEIMAISTETKEKVMRTHGYAGRFSALRSRLTGALLEPHNAGYGEARAIWNGMIEKRPAAIVMAETDADVAASVRFARENGLQLSVRGGGHNV